MKFKKNQIDISSPVRCGLTAMPCIVSPIKISDYVHRFDALALVLVLSLSCSCLGGGRRNMSIQAAPASFNATPSTPLGTLISMVMAILKARVTFPAFRQTPSKTLYSPKFPVPTSKIPLLLDRILPQTPILLFRLLTLRPRRHTGSSLLLARAFQLGKCRRPPYLL